MRFLFPHDWRRLRAEANRRNLRIAAVATASVGARLKALQEERQELLDEAEVLHAAADKAEAAGEKPDADGEERWQAIMQAETGELARVDAKIAKAEETAAQVKALAAARQQGVAPDPFGRPQGSSKPDPLAAVVNRGSRLRNFGGETPERDAFVAGAFLLATAARCRPGGAPNAKAEEILRREGWHAEGGRKTILDAQTEGTDAAGGFLVPDPLSRSIIDVRDMHGVMRRLSRLIPMTSDTLKVPKRAGGLTVDYSGEATAITASDKAWAQVPLTAVKRSTLTKISNELREDALINVVDDIVSEIGTALGINEDREFINGDGTGGFGGVTGLLAALGAASKNASAATWANLSLSDFTDTMAVLPERFWGYPLAWVCSASFYFQVMLRELVEAGGNAVANLESGGAASPRFLGYPVEFTEQMPRTAGANTPAVFGAFSQATIVGDRVGVQIGQSDQFAFDEDVLTVRARVRYDVNVHEAGDGSNAGAIVGLTTAAT